MAAQTSSASGLPSSCDVPVGQAYLLLIIAVLLCSVPLSISWLRELIPNLTDEEYECELTKLRELGAYTAAGLGKVSEAELNKKNVLPALVGVLENRRLLRGNGKSRYRERCSCITVASPFVAVSLTLTCVATTLQRKLHCPLWYPRSHHLVSFCCHQNQDSCMFLPYGRSVCHGGVPS